MTFVEAANQSKTFTRAWGDLAEGFRRRELWLHLGWQDIKQKYRRSVLGPFWITIATGTTAIAMGLLYSTLFNLELSEHLPYVVLGLIIWNMINAAILEGSEVFIANEGLIKQLPTSLSVHVYRLVQGPGDFVQCLQILDKCLLIRLHLLLPAFDLKARARSGRQIHDNFLPTKTVYQIVGTHRHLRDIIRHSQATLATSKRLFLNVRV